MAASPEKLTFRPLRLACLLACLLAGCRAPPATVELIAVAEKALTGAADFQAAQHADQLRQLDAQMAALDAAFDADARLAEAGKIINPSGEPVKLTADWVVSARKGYAVAASALAQQRCGLEAAHATARDNLAAASEALELARELILEHSSLSGRAKQLLTSMQRRFAND